MFDLMRTLGDWRREISSDSTLDRESVDELEAHVLDAMERHLDAGMDPEAAFQKAVMQLGTSKAIQFEFQKLSSFPLGFMKSQNVDALSFRLLVVAVLLSAVAGPAVVRFGWSPACLYLSTLAMLARAAVEWHRAPEKWGRGLLWMAGMLLVYGFILPFWAKMHAIHGDAYTSVPFVDGGAILLNAAVTLCNPVITRLRGRMHRGLAS